MLFKTSVFEDHFFCSMTCYYLWVHGINENGSTDLNKLTNEIGLSVVAPTVHNLGLNLAIHYGCLILMTNVIYLVSSNDSVIFI